MAVTFVGSSQGANTNNTDGTSVTVDTPAGTQEGDFMVAIVAGYNPADLSHPGWTWRAQNNDGTGLYSWFYYRVATSSEPSTHTWTWSGAGGAINVGMAVFRGTDGFTSGSVANPRSNVSGTTDPANSDRIFSLERRSLGCGALVWRDNGGSGVSATASTGIEMWDISRTDGGSSLIERGQAAYYASSETAEGGDTPNFVINPTDSITHGISWSWALAAIPTGSLSGSFGSLSGDFAGQVQANSNGTLTGTFGSLTADMEGFVTPAGSISGTFGSLTASMDSFTGPAAEDWNQEGIAVEFKLGDEWTDVTDYVQYNEKIVISRGQSGEGSDPDISQAQFTLDNRDGRFSPRNPTSPYYGKLGRNVPVRISKSSGDVAMYTPGQPDPDYLNNVLDCYTTDDYPELDISGDMDVRIDCEPETWRMEQYLIGRYSNYGGGRSWALWVDDEGYLKFNWNEGVGGFFVNADDPKSTVPVPNVLRQAVRATLDVDNGSSAWEVKFYTADDISGTWTQLGDTITGDDTTSLAAYNIPLTLGAETGEGGITTSSFGSYRGIIHAAKLYDGIDDTLVTNPDFSLQESGVRTFQDSLGVTWKSVGEAICSNRHYRFHGELSELPQRWESTGNYAWVECQASGIRRRIEQGSVPIKSAMRRFYTSPIFTRPVTAVLGPYNVLQYWPCEDLAGARTLASAVPGQPPMLVFGEPTLSTYTGFPGSDALPQLKTGSGFKGIVVNGAEDAFTIDFLLSVPDAGLAIGDRIITLAGSGTIKHWDFSYSGSDTVNLAGRTDGNTLDAYLFTTGAMDMPVTGNDLIISISSSDTDVFVRYQIVGTDDWVSAGSATVDGTMGRITNVHVNPDGSMNDVTVGHVALWDETVFRSGTVNTDPLNGYITEEADERVARVLFENDIPSYIIGAKSSLMGYQTPKTLVDVVKDAMNTDLGFMFETRNFPGLGYRTRNSLYNQSPIIELDYSAHELSGELLPEEDDSLTKNKVTVTRDGGSSHTVEDTASNMSSQAPPAGVGLYESSATVSLSQDDDALQNAGWRLHLGTVDEARYKKVTLATENPRFAADTAKIETLLKMDLGHRFTISNLPDWMPVEDVSQMIVGYSETFDQFTHSINFTCVPESPYEIGQVVRTTSTTSSKAGSNKTTLNADITSSATSMEVAIEDGSALWGTSLDDFDIMVGGERMTVTAVSGTSSPQTFTVTRSVNGVTKAHEAGAKVKLFKLTILAL